MSGGACLDRDDVAFGATSKSDYSDDEKELATALGVALGAVDQQP